MDPNSSSSGAVKAQLRVATIKEAKVITSSSSMAVRREDNPSGSPNRAPEVASGNRNKLLEHNSGNSQSKPLQQLDSGSRTKPQASGNKNQALHQQFTAPIHMDRRLRAMA